MRSSTFSSGIWAMFCIRLRGIGRSAGLIDSFYEKDRECLSLKQLRDTPLHIGQVFSLIIQGTTHSVWNNLWPHLSLMVSSILSKGFMQITQF